MKNGIIISIVLCVLISCRQKENKDIRPVNMTDTIATEKDSLTSATSNEQIADTITMRVTDYEGFYNAVGTIDSTHSKVYVKFTNTMAGKLRATITPKEGDGNIRFNQIIFPDKSSDGPFSKVIEYDIKIIGEHTLVIGHSLMADGQYLGKFAVRLELYQ